jgi:hypothetical protein
VAAVVGGRRVVVAVASVVAVPIEGTCMLLFLLILTYFFSPLPFRWGSLGGGGGGRRMMVVC